MVLVGPGSRVQTVPATLGSRDQMVPEALGSLGRKVLVVLGSPGQTVLVAVDLESLMNMNSKSSSYNINYLTWSRWPLPWESWFLWSERSLRRRPSHN